MNDELTNRGYFILAISYCLVALSWRFFIRGEPPNKNAACYVRGNPAHSAPLIYTCDFNSSVTRRRTPLINFLP
jgi:hypothetical protein